MSNSDKPISDEFYPNRRSVAVALVTATIGSLVALFPVLAGLGVVLDPLRRRNKTGASEANDAAGGNLVRICALSALPPDGLPRPFPVTTVVEDAWSRTAGQRVGMVYLRHVEADGKPQVTALTAECPHLGCSVDFNGGNEHYECPCHVSAFAVDGAKISGPSLRGLDPLEAKIIDQHGQQEVWVRFERFRTGIAERVPIT